jgi:hypothetical protein
VKEIETMAKIAGAAAVLSALALVASASAASPLMLGPSAHEQLTLYHGFYDGHKDGYVITDVSSKSQASAWHVNYSPAIGEVKAAPRQFFVEGKAASGQLAVFGSEPGETDYNPLWEEIVVKWKSGATPVLLVRDDQIDSLAKSGKLTESDAHVVLNAPITSVGSKTTIG